MTQRPLLPDEAKAAGVQTFVDVLEFRAHNQPSDLVFRSIQGDCDEIGVLTYAELDRQARAIAVRLAQHTVPGDRVVLLVNPGLEYIATFFGCLFAGVVAVPAYPPNPRRSDTRVARIVEDSGARVALASNSLMVRLESWLSLTPEVRNLTWLDAGQLLDGDATAWRSPAITSASLAMLQYTSGSTGDPRGVMLSHRNLLHNSQVLHYVSECREGDCGVTWLPPFHDMGLIGGVLQPIYSNVPVTLMAPATFLQRPVRWLEAISRYRATTSGAPNFAYDLCVDRIAEFEFDTLDLACWRTSFNGAEPVRAETIARFTQTFARCGLRPDVIVPCYGLAEATLLVSGGPMQQLPHVVQADRAGLESGELRPARASDAGSVALVASGVPFNPGNLAIVDPDTGLPAAPGTIGEIWVAGPNVSAGYWSRPVDTTATFQASLPGRTEQFLRTGDFGVLDDGHLIVTGRLKDLVIINGRNYYPHDIEMAAEKSHAHLRAGFTAAFSIPGIARERLILMAEVGRQHQSALDGAVFQAIRIELAASIGVVPDEILLLRQQTIPRTSSGKIQRRACRVAYLENGLEVVARWKTPASDTVPATDALLAFIVDWIQGELPLDTARLDARTSLRDIGLDSLSVVRLAVALEERTGKRIDPALVWTQPDLGSLVAALVETASAGNNTSAHRSRRVFEPESGDIATWGEYHALQSRLNSLATQGVTNPFFQVHDGVSGHHTVIDGKPFINFSNYNYLGLSGHPAVTHAAQRAIEQWGSSVSASRIVAGERAIHRQLERALADFIGVGDALLYIGGYPANISTIAHLMGNEDVVLCDALLHNSAMLGAEFSGARRLTFPHNDWAALDGILHRVRSRHRRALVIIEGAYSADGDVPDLAHFVDVKGRHQAMLMVDEAHSFGVLGETGRGLSEHAGVPSTQVDIWMGTLSKSLASCGGYIAGGHALVEYLRYTSPGFVYSVGMTPANAAAALAALQLIQAEPERIAMLRKRAARFHELCQESGVLAGTNHGTPIIPIVVGSSLRALRVCDYLFQAGIHVQPMIAPAVPEHQARLRFFVASTHTETELMEAVRVLAEALQAIPGDTDRPEASPSAPVSATQ